MSFLLSVLLLAWLGCASNAGNGSSTEVCESGANVLLQTAPNQRSAKHSPRAGTNAGLAASTANTSTASKQVLVPQDEEVHRLWHAVGKFLLIKRADNGSGHAQSVKIPGCPVVPLFPFWGVWVPLPLNQKKGHPFFRLGYWGSLGYLASSRR